MVEEEPRTDAREHERPAPGAGDGVHAPVLVDEVIDVFARAFADAPLGWYLDGTIGAGGHARRLLERFAGLEVLGSDWDPDSLIEARRTLEPFGERARLVRGRLSEIERTAAAHASVQESVQESVHESPGQGAPLAILADLGVCSLHLDRADRGFSFASDGPLDMRMDPDAELTAADIVNGWHEERLADLFYHEGGERKSRRIAAAVVESRRRLPFKRTVALAQVVADALGGVRGKTHPATRTFQALRRAVNGEGQELEALVDAAPRVLAPGGVLAVITFHSGEDGVLKRRMRGGVKSGAWRELTDGAVEPRHHEVRRNARARSARLRAYQLVEPVEGGVA